LADPAASRSPQITREPTLPQPSHNARRPCLASPEGAGWNCLDNRLVLAVAISSNPICLSHDIDYSLTALKTQRGSKMTNLPNRNNSLSQEALREEVALRIAETRTQYLRTRELIGQSQRLTVQSLRILIFNCRDRGSQSEFWRRLFEILNKKANL